MLRTQISLEIEKPCRAHTGPLGNLILCNTVGSSLGSKNLAAPAPP